MKISNNQFVNNNAKDNSAGILMKKIKMITIQNNRFENNEAQYGTCLNSELQDPNYKDYDKSIITISNEFINNRAL